MKGGDTMALSTNVIVLILIALLAVIMLCTILGMANTLKSIHDELYEIKEEVREIKKGEK